MAAPQSGVVAPWATRDDLCAPCATPPDGVARAVEDITMDRFLLIASDYLFERTGRRWCGSVTNVTARPAVRALGDGSPSPRFGGTGAGSLGSFDYRSGGPGGSFGFYTYGAPLTRPGCGLAEITLGIYPLTSIASVKVDGVTLSPADYRIDDYRWLVRLDGKGWPAGQRMDLADSEAGTFSVTFTGGMAPPRGGVAACASLACQLGLAATSSPQCRLPGRIQTMTRQGITATFNDAVALLAENLIGIPEVDLFVSTYNKHGLRRRASIHSPDLPRPVRRATG